MTDRYTRAELQALLTEQLPDVPAAALDRVAGVLVLLLRPAAPPAPPPAAPARGARRTYKEKPAAERLGLKRP